jgi:hypothetical protein
MFLDIFLKTERKPNLVALLMGANSKIRLWVLHLQIIFKVGSTNMADNIAVTLEVVGFEVLTVVVTKSTIFWDITPCSPLKVN